MSVFDFPRIHISGTIQLNPGTANNEDYAQAPPTAMFQGQPLALLKSAEVEARTYGKSDDEFIAWVQKEHTFELEGGGTARYIPAEWNYYGDMSSTITTEMHTKVVGVQTGPDAVYSERTEGVELSEAVGAGLTLNGGITDINPEGSPPATQFFIDQFDLKLGSKPLISGGLSKAVGQWINFYRNVNVQGDGGAGSYVYHAFPGVTPALPGWPAAAKGVIFRYYLFNAELADASNGTNAAIANVYKNKGTNPKNLQIVGTFAPLLDEEIRTVPTGRLLVMDEANLKTPTAINNGKGRVALGPAVVDLSGGTLTADFSGTFPEQMGANSNDKWDFGPVTLYVSAKGEEPVEIGPVDYADTAAGDARGWLFDYDVSANQPAMFHLLQDDAVLQLRSPKSDTVQDEVVLKETDYYFVSNQQSVYGEQKDGSESLFANNSGTPEEEIKVKVFRRGQELKGEQSPTLTVWEYNTVPMESSPQAKPNVITECFQPDQPLVVDVSKAGCRLYTFAVNGPDGPPKGFPPADYQKCMFPPFVTNAPMISMRVLPNEDFSRYYEDPTAVDPVGNDALTFDVVYEKVLKVYYLLFPTMAVQPYPFLLNDAEQMQQFARSIIQRTMPTREMWLTTGYMPRTRDLSRSRRTLLHAWCRKYL